MLCKLFLESSNKTGTIEGVCGSSFVPKLAAVAVSTNVNNFS